MLSHKGRGEAEHAAKLRTRTGLARPPAPKMHMRMGGIPVSGDGDEADFVLDVHA